MVYASSPRSVHLTSALSTAVRPVGRAGAVGQASSGGKRILARPNLADVVRRASVKWSTGASRTVMITSCGQDVGWRPF
jgi:hypothetical protein